MSIFLCLKLPVSDLGWPSRIPQSQAPSSLLFFYTQLPFQDLSGSSKCKAAGWGAGGGAVHARAPSLRKGDQKLPLPLLSHQLKLSYMLAPLRKRDWECDDSGEPYAPLKLGSIVALEERLKNTGDSQLYLVHHPITLLFTHQILWPKLDRTLTAPPSFNNTL